MAYEAVTSTHFYDPNAIYLILAIILVGYTIWKFLNFKDPVSQIEERETMGVKYWERKK